MYKKYFYYFLLLNISFSTMHELIPEKLTYLVGFRYLPAAGNALLSIKSDSLNGIATYTLSTDVKTNNFLDKFYQIRDKTISSINKENFSLLKIDKDIKEGNYTRKHSAHNQGDSLLVWNKKKYRINSLIYDPIAFIYYLRSKELLLGDIYSFFSVGAKGIKEVKVKISAKEIIKVPAGIFNCFKIEPKSINKKSILKNNGEMKVWLSDDKMKIPIKIEMKTNVGTILMKLQ